MSTKNRATGGTEDEFQAALVTYTKAGNKTAAMRRLWNAAYEMGKSAGDDAVFEGRMVKEEQVKEKEAVEAAKRAGFEEGRWTGFEEGRQAGEKEASSMDAFEVSFAAGKVAGIATGMERGREAETQRWKDGGHFENGTCRTLNTTIVDSSFPPQSLPIDDAADTFLVPGAFSAHAGLNWADDAESLPIHSVLVTPRPRDFSDLRTSSTNPFDTLQRRHARHHGAQTRRRTRLPRPYSPRPDTRSWIAMQRPPTTPSDPLASKSSGLGSFIGILAWIWIFLCGPSQGRISVD
ncbi:hypothetical protein B0H19DRAFT_1098523 [Mycena capillaripes]|nr:hypothetical protein B0H19DRAFT_1098523 [Mycena capillaripes]